MPTWQDRSNPFARVFDPDERSLFGVIGGLAGVPTTRDVAGQAQSEAMAQLSEIQQRTNDPQRTILEFLKTPQGMNMMSSGDPNSIQVLKQWADTVTPPNPQQIQVSPGGQTILRTPQGQEVGRYSMPTSEFQTFKGMSELAGLNSDQIKTLAMANMLPRGNQGSDSQRAIDALVASGVISKETGQLMQSGFLKIMPRKDELGRDTGNYDIVDGANQTTTPLRPKDGSAQPAGQPQPRQFTPAESNPDGTVNPDKAFPGNKLNMFLGGGLAPNIAIGLNAILSTVNPSLGLESGMKSSDRQGYIQQVENALLTLRDAGSGLNIPARVIENALALAPKAGLMADPKTSIQDGIRLWDLTQEQIKQADATLTDPRISPAVKIEADKRRQGWLAVQRSLPERPAMVSLLEAVKSGTADAVTPTTVIQEGATGISSAAREAGSVVQQGRQTINGQTPQPAPAKPAAAPEAPSKVDIMKLSPNDLLTVDARTLNTAQRQQLLDRLRVIAKSKGKQ